MVVGVGRVVVGVGGFDVVVGAAALERFFFVAVDRDGGGVELVVVEVGLLVGGVVDGATLVGVDIADVTWPVVTPGKVSEAGDV